MFSLLGYNSLCTHKPLNNANKMNDKRQCCNIVATQRETIWRILLMTVSIGGLLPTRRQAII